jgi:RNAse (barnase) inhibitor barstar
MPTIQLPTEKITNWQTFHQVCRDVFGFPDFYGMNMNAWIDCLTYIDEEDGMSTVHVAPGEHLTIEVRHTKQFQSQVPDIFVAFLDSVAIVNQRHIADGKSPMLALIFL